MRPDNQVISLAPYALVAALTIPLAFLLRFDVAVLPASLLVAAFCIFLPVKLTAFYFSGIHKTCRSLVGISDCMPLIIANIVATLGATALALLIGGRAFPRSVAIIDLLLSILFTGIVSFWDRLISEVVKTSNRTKTSEKQVLIYGAGAAGSILARELRTNTSLGYRVIGFLDDDRRTHGRTIAGVRVLGSGSVLPNIVPKLKEKTGSAPTVLIALPSAKSHQVREAVEHCRASAATSKIIPSLAELVHGKQLIEQTRDLVLEDLLGRQPIVLDESAIRRDLADATVMVTGGAGSIGSELCRQITKYNPRKLIIFDQAESELFMLHRAVRRLCPAVETVAEIGDICHSTRLNEVLLKHKVEVIFHAAAYKHVPMMEENVLEAAQNNVLGTYNVLRAAEQCNVGLLLMISSDKAVNPTNVMGLTKRVAELLISSTPHRDRAGRLRCVSVRFGNVLGSNGSVIPIFREQIAAGGPVTVTHPEMKRYFMTIPEAVQLVLQASSMGKGSEIFVLDMGEPVRIIDLAQHMIRLAGYQPGVDMQIQFTGLRPGEKLFEELSNEGESILPTYHEKIKIFSSPVPCRPVLDSWIQELKTRVADRAELAVIQHLAGIVPEYTPVDQWKILLLQEQFPEMRTATA